MTTYAKIPVTVIGGFLGAGKTTFVNHLLRSSGKRLGVIVNEFGKMGVDGALIQEMSDQPSDVQELTAGCLCCSGRDDLIRALVGLAQQAHQAVQAGEPQIEQVLIELSGVADPVPVLHTLLDPDVKTLFELDSLITVADAQHLPQTLTENPEAALQLAYATSVILNKTDLVTPQQLELAKSIVGGLQPLAHILPAQNGVVADEAGSPQRLLAQHGFDADWTPPAIQTQHTAGLKSFVLEAQQPLTAMQWYDFVERIVSRPGQVLRVKGHISLEASPHKLLLHAVRDVLTLEPTDQPADGISRVVMIGRDLVPDEERAAFGGQ